MPVESAEDRASFVHADEFGTTATYTLSGGSPEPLAGIFDENYQLLGSFENEVGMEGGSPVFQTSSDLLPDGAATGDEILINSVNYSVVELLADDDGMPILRLQKA